MAPIGHSWPLSCQPRFPGTNHQKCRAQNGFQLCRDGTSHSWGPGANLCQQRQGQCRQMCQARFLGTVVERLSVPSKSLRINVKQNHRSGILVPEQVAFWRDSINGTLVRVPMNRKTRCRAKPTKSATRSAIKLKSGGESTKSRRYPWVIPEATIAAETHRRLPRFEEALQSLPLFTGVEPNEPRE
jgi:hypothetical protein